MLVDWHTTVFVGKFRPVKKSERDLWGVQRFQFNLFKKLVFSQFQVQQSAVRAAGWVQLQLYWCETQHWVVHSLTGLLLALYCCCGAQSSLLRWSTLRPGEKVDDVQAEGPKGAFCHVFHLRWTRSKEVSKRSYPSYYCFSAEHVNNSVYWRVTTTAHVHFGTWSTKRGTG